MCKHGDVFSRPVLIGRGLGLDTQLRENKQLQTRRIVHRYGVLRDSSPSHISTLTGSERNKNVLSLRD